MRQKAKVFPMTIVGALLIALLLTPISLPPARPAGAASPETATWTFMVYMVADNNLEGAGIDDFLEMAAAGSGANINIVVQFDRIPGYDTSYGNWTTTKRYRVEAGMVPDPASALMDIGEANMGDPQTVIDFVNWARANYPADHYVLVFWNHGGGWLEGFGPHRAGIEDFCWDDTDDDYLTSAEMYQILDIVTDHGTAPIDIIGFDACLMGMWEVDNQAKPFAAVTVSSEESEPWDGWPYDDILLDLQAHPDWGPAALGADIVQRYYESYGNDNTMSAKDLGAAYTSLNEAVDFFALTLIGHDEAYHDEIDLARYNSQPFSSESYIDLYDFADRVHQYIADPDVRAAAAAVMAAVDGAVILERHGPYWPRAHGIDFYFPTNLWGWSAYQALLSSQWTHWDEFVAFHITGQLPRGWVEGYVIADPPGEPLAGALVTAREAGRAGLLAITDPDGYYSMLLPAGTYDLTAAKPGYSTQVVTGVVIVDGVTVTQDFVLQPEPDIVVDPPALEAALYPDQMVTQTLWISNVGAAELTFTLREATRTVTVGKTASWRARAEDVVDPAVWEQVRAGGQARVLIYLREVADLSPAYAMRDWEARGRFVYERLRETAERSGGPLRALLEAAGAEPRVLFAANAIAATLDAALLAEVAGRPEVAQVKLNRILPPPDDERIAGGEAVEWNIQKIRADQVWITFGVTGQGVTVGLVDSGVMYNHPALVNQYRGNLGGGNFDHNYNWFDFVAGQPAPYDDSSLGRGTFGMGIAVGSDGGINQIGVAPGARWVAVKVDYSLADLHAAMDWMLAPTDLSGGNPRPDLRPQVGWVPVPFSSGCDEALRPDVQAWRAAGIVPVMRNGSQGPNCYTAVSPGDYPESFVAAATDINDIIHSGSSRGPSCYSEVKPNVAAPGVNIRSAYNDGGYVSGYSGNSWSAAHLAGAAALVLSADPTLDVAAVEHIITSTAVCRPDLQCGGSNCHNNVYGWGRIDAFEAVSKTLGGIEVDIPWLSEYPLSGTLAPSGSVPIVVTLDATGLAAGVYKAGLNVESNDPDTPIVSIPVTLTVYQPEPDIVVEPPALEATLYPDQVSTQTLWIGNVGTAELTFTLREATRTVTLAGAFFRPQADIPWLSEYPLSGTVAPSESVSILVTFTAGLLPGVYQAGLDVESNDPDTPRVSVPVTLTVLARCDPVTATAFAWLPVTPTVGEAVTFTGWATGTPPIDLAWDFGDGDTGEGPVTTHTYVAAGRYRVVMTATNCATATATVAHTVTVVCAPVQGADFAWTPFTPTAGQVVTFTGWASGTPPLTLTWDLGDDTWAEGTEVTHTYDLAGLYTVTLTATNCAGNVVTATHPLTIVAGCDPVQVTSIGWEPITPTAGQPVTFTGTASGSGPLSFTWNFGDGETAGGEVVTHSYAFSGTYTVVLTATNACWMDMAMGELTVLPVPPGRFWAYLPLVFKEAGR